MTAFNQLNGTTKRRLSLAPTNLETHRENYMADIVAMFQQYEEVGDGDFLEKSRGQRNLNDADDDDVGDEGAKENDRNSKGIYSRQQMKAKSLHLVEENLKKD